MQLATGAADLRCKTTATIECPKSMVGRVIGKNGETIKALQTYTGSLIQVNQADNPCTITISGSPQSLSLAVSMVADIVKGTFKGFALLRQVATSGNSRAPTPPVVQAPPQLPQALPVYAPGYGLIPPSQLYGGEADAAIPGVSQPLGHGSMLQSGLAWSAVNGVQHPGLLDLTGQQGGQRVYNSSSTAAALLSSAPSLSAPSVYSTMPVRGNGQYAGMPQELTGMMPGSEAILFQGGAGARYPGLHVTDGSQMGNGVSLMQAAASRSQLNHRGAGWLAHGAPGNQASYSAVPAGNFGVGELVDGGGMPGASPAGNLVMDANGQVFYINAANMLN